MAAAAAATSVRCRLEELILLDTYEASKAVVTAHLVRYADAVANVGGTMATCSSPSPRLRSDVCAALEAMPEDMQLAVLCHLSDYDVIALLACRKAPCFSEQTCRQLCLLHPPPTQVPRSWDWKQPKPHSFEVQWHDSSPFCELRRHSYQRGVRSKYGLAVCPDDDLDPANCFRYTSLDVPGDTVLVSEVTTRLAEPGPGRESLPEYLYDVYLKCAHRDARLRWKDGKPRWFPPLVRVTEQGHSTDGRVGQFVVKYKGRL